jgi:hypothetical protein
MEWKLKGIDRASGKARVVILDCERQSDAVELAGIEGLDVKSVKPFKPLLDNRGMFVVVATTGVLSGGFISRALMSFGSVSDPKLIAFGGIGIVLALAGTAIKQSSSTVLGRFVFWAGVGVMVVVARSGLRHLAEPST